MDRTRITYEHDAQSEDERARARARETLRIWIELPFFP